MNYKNIHSKIIANKIIKSFKLQPLIDSLDNVEEAQIEDAKKAIESCPNKLFLAKLLKLNKVITIKTIHTHEKHPFTHLR
jgi:hypothetical protein